MTIAAIVLLAGYATLVLELTVLRVPSVASTLSIWRASSSIASGYSPQFRGLFELPGHLKALLFAFPIAVVNAVYVYPLVELRFGPDVLGDYLYTPGPVVTAGGIVMVAAGRIIALSAALQIRRDNEQKGESFYLHTTGSFRWSRNPGLVGMYLFIFGIWLMMPSVSLLAGIVLYMVHMDLKVRMEEDFLGNRFGEPYAAYRAQTRRYIL